MTSSTTSPMSPSPTPPPNPWREVVIDALVVAGIYRATHDTDPRQALHDLLAWETTIALDPAVSEGARALLAGSRSSAPEAGGEDTVTREQFDALAAAGTEAFANDFSPELSLVVFRSEDAARIRAALPPSAPERGTETTLSARDAVRLLVQEQEHCARYRGEVARLRGALTVIAEADHGPADYDTQATMRRIAYDALATDALSALPAREGTETGGDTR